MIGQPKRTDSSPYKEYKASNVDWTDSIPQHWNTQRLRNSLSSHTSGVWGADADGISDLPCLRVADFDRNQWRVRTDNPTTRAITQSERQGKVIRSGNLLLEKSGGGEKQPVGTVVLYDHELEATCSNFIEKLVVAESHDPRFLKYVHSTLYGLGVNRRSIKQTTGIQNIDLNSYLSEKFPFPPPKEQAAIVRFLDHADEQIRRYIASKERLIALLEEERQALVHQGVTRGLDPTVRLKPSGVEWLGEVPEHWSVQRLKTVCQMKSGEGITAMSIESEGEYPVYGGNGLRGYTSDFTHDGEHVLIGRQGALCGNVHVVEGRFWASEHAVVATPHPKCMVGWLGPVLEAMNLNQYSISAAQPGLAVERILNLWIVVPTQEEQSTVAEQIGEQATEIASTMAQARRQIDLMNEYRTRLIADVVTGQLDVREATAQLPGDVLGRTNPGS